MPTYLSYLGGNALPVGPTRAEKAQQAGWPVVASNPTILAPIWPNFTFPKAVTGVFYSEQWDLRPAFSPTNYSLVSGTLPPGLVLTSPSGDLGLLAGTPTVAGTYTFTLNARNLYGSVNKTFTIVAVAGGGSGYSATFAG